MRGHLALAWIGSSLLLEVPIDGAALHETAHRSAPRANNDFLVSERGCECRISLFRQILEQ